MHAPAFISVVLAGTVALTGCGLVDVGKDVVNAVKGGQPLDQAIAAATAGDTALALQEAQAIGDTNSVSCLQRANAIAQMIAKDGPSQGIATDMERAIAAKQVEIVCAGPVINSGKALLLP